MNLDFLFNLGSIELLGLLIIFSFTNGFILLPASQAILIIGGIFSIKSNINFWVIFSSLVISNFLGNYLLYYITYKWGEKTARKFLPIKKKTLDNQILIINFLFKKYGNYIILIGRNLPVLHSLISVPSGIAKIKKTLFSIYTFIGIIIWSLLFMGIGMYFGENYEKILQQYNLIGSISIIIFLGAGYYFFKKYTNKILKLAKQDLTNK